MHLKNANDFVLTKDDLKEIFYTNLCHCSCILFVCLCLRNQYEIFTVLALITSESGDQVKYQ